MLSSSGNKSISIAVSSTGAKIPFHIVGQEISMVITKRCWGGIIMNINKTIITINSLIIGKREGVKLTKCRWQNSLSKITKYSVKHKNVETQLTTSLLDWTIISALSNDMFYFISYKKPSLPSELNLHTTYGSRILGTIAVLKNTSYHKISPNIKIFNCSEIESRLHRNAAQSHCKAIRVT